MIKILLALMLTISFNGFCTTEIDTLKERLTQLEQQNNNKITIGGEVKVKYNVNKLADGNSNNIISLSKAKLSIAATINEQFDAYLTLLEDDDKIIAYEAILNFKMLDGKYTLAAGRLYVPFGVYETEAISDPTGSDIGETKDVAIVLNANLIDGFNSAIWLTDNDDKNSGLSLNYISDNFSAGVDWIDKIMAADNQSGLAIHANYVLDDITLIVERISSNSSTNTIQSTQIEVDYVIDDFVFAFMHNTIDNFGDYTSNIILAGQYTLAAGVDLAMEYKTQEKKDNKGNDEKITLSLAYKF